MRSILVQKFGGTSLGEASRLENIYQILRSYSEEHTLIVVVSAMSGTLKEEGTTAKLLLSIQEASKKGNFLRYAKEIQDFHEKIVDDLDFSSSNYKNWAKEKIGENLKYLSSFLEAISVIGEASAKTSDVVIAIGEKLSAIILSAYLNSKNLDSAFLDLSELITHSYKSADFLFLQDLRNLLKKRIEEVPGKIPVATGFLGHVPGGILEGIGRGYSDFTAAAIAASVHAKELQIWKEVDGIYSADPRKVDNAYILPSISPEEAAEITFYGSEVIHPFTMEQVVHANIPTRIKNTWFPDRPGTVIEPNGENVAAAYRPTAVTCKRNVTVVNFRSNRMLMSYGFMAKVFNILERHAIIIDLISTSEVNISLTTTNTTSLMAAVEECKEFSEVHVMKGQAIVSLVGLGMKSTLGTASHMFQTLAAQGINIEMITQGASEINISCVVRDEDALKALRAVHEAMLVNAIKEG